jgi:hypothetical protein
MIGGQWVRAAAIGPKKRKGRMQFEVNGRQYFLNFTAAEGEWLLLTPTAKGFRRLAIVHDDAVPFSGSVLNPEDGGRKSIN